MSQRGGSVETYVKYGKKVNSPLVSQGSANFIIAFEQLEAFRWITYLKKGGTIIVNTQAIMPMPVITGAATYPENIISKIKENDINVLAFDALTIAKECGNSKSVNVVLLGILAKNLNIEKEYFLNALKEVVPSKFLELNLKAFERGYTI